MVTIVHPNPPVLCGKKADEGIVEQEMKMVVAKRRVLVGT